MLGGVKRVGSRVARGLAALPLQLIAAADQRTILQGLTSAMVTEVPVEDGILRFSTPTQLLYWRAEGLLAKEPDMIAWIDTFQPDDIFWDVGANVGVFSLYAARRPGVQVLAFEPSADNYAALCTNVLLNAMGDRVIPYCIALAGATELAMLNSPTRETGAALHQFGKPGTTSRYWRGEVSYSQGMIGYTIDDFIAQFTPPFPTRLKLDVDGLEAPILEGARKTLADPRFRSIMVELNQNDEDEKGRANHVLSQAGLECVATGQRFELGGEVAVNHYFARTGTA